MSYDDFNVLLEEVATNPTDDTKMLENFEKLREAFKELDNNLKEAVEKVNEISKKYEELRQSKVSDFFARDDGEEVKEVKEELEEAIDEVEEIKVDDLFDDDVDVEVIDEDLLVEEEEEE